MRLLWGLALCTCVASVWAAPAQSPQATEMARLVTVFTDRVQAYVALQKTLEGSAQTSTAESGRIAGRQHELAGSIATARREARRGDIFTPEVSALFQRIISSTFRGPEGRRMRRTILEGDPVPLTVLSVNAVYPEEIPVTTTPPTLLRRLPSLPEELAYRIVGRTLVLQDIKTNMIVDFIPDAIPAVR